MVMASGPQESLYKGFQAIHAFVIRYELNNYFSCFLKPSSL